ncbi:MAG: hypothetical protein HRT38_10330 [Alteromonadaceae bacterium]|nr:hypothetical protein [Alteromonadaceae bacterium]
MLLSKLQTLFNDYLAGFRGYNIAQLQTCYHLPCTLNTPDNIVLVKNEQALASELGKILAQLKQGDIETILPVSASYEAINENLALVSIDWHFIDNNGQMFADFCAIYHVQINAESAEIINVASHELSNSLSLANPLLIHR